MEKEQKLVDNMANAIKNGVEKVFGCGSEDGHTEKAINRSRTETTVEDELFRIAALAKAARMVKVDEDIRKDAYLEDITECVIRAMAKLQEYGTSYIAGNNCTATDWENENAN